MKCSHTTNSELIGPSCNVKRMRYRCLDCGAEFVLDSKGKVVFVGTTRNNMEREFKQVDEEASKLGQYMANALTLFDLGRGMDTSLQLRAAAHSAVRLADQLMSMAIVVEKAAG